MASQRQLARSARMMLDAATRALTEARHQGSGTSGLGFVCLGACIASIAAIAAGIAILVTGALIYSWAQSSSELRAAMLYADRICRETPGGCTPEQRAALVRDLRMPDAVTAGVLNITGGPYKIENYRAKATVVYLNKVPTSQYRAVGHPIGISVGEHMIDRAAEATGLDPVEIRRRNVMPDDGYPAVAASGVPVKDLSHEACLDKLVAMMDYDGLLREQAALRGQGVQRGIGIAGFIKGTAPGPQGYYGTGGAPIASHDACTIKL